MKEEEFFKKRITDLANAAYKRGVNVYSDFLNVDEISMLMGFQRELNFVNINLWGGYDAADRKMVCLSEKDDYNSSSANSHYPLSYLHIKPVLKKFSDELTHRDFLGALMNLGIKREVLGDIIVAENEAFLICLTSISEYIIENLTRIKHTVVTTTLTDELPSDRLDTSFEKVLTLPSLRLDALIGEVYSLSRKQAQEKIALKNVYINNRLCENNSRVLKTDDVVNVRGNGKFVLLSDGETTRKGRIRLTVKIY